MNGTKQWLVSALFGLLIGVGTYWATQASANANKAADNSERITRLETQYEAILTSLNEIKTEIRSR